MDLFDLTSITGDLTGSSGVTMTTLYLPINDAYSTLAAPRTTGSPNLTLKTGDGPLFGNPTPQQPIRITLQRLGDERLNTILACTGRTGDTLTGLTVLEGTTDRNYGVGDLVEVRVTAGTVLDVHSVLAGKADTVHTHQIGDVTGLQTALDSKASAAGLASHVADTANPHGVTKAQVGLSNADNTSDLAKPLSTAAIAALAGKANTVHTHQISDVTGLTAALGTFATSTALSAHVADQSNPHGVTKAQVGLGSVDNTSDLNKPLSTATITALAGKAPTNHTHTYSQITDLGSWSGSTALTTLGVVATGTWQGSAIAVGYLGSGTPSAGKYLDGSGTWMTLPSGGGSATPGGPDGSIQYNDGGALGGGSDVARVGTGQIRLNSQFGARTIANAEPGSGLVLSGNSGVGYGDLRIIANSGGWSDDQVTAYFQINSSSKNCSFLSGTYGADVPFNRLQFVAQFTTIYSNSSGQQGYNETPVPISTFEVVTTVPARPVVGVVGASSQTADLLQFRRGSTTALSGVDCNGYVRSRVGSGAPTDSPPDGSFYADNANSELYVRFNGVWKKVALA